MSASGVSKVDAVSLDTLGGVDTGRTPSQLLDLLAEISLEVD